ncbi:MFS transporter [Helicobacter sp.]|uniref:MFS transporter n=1 Tax=Helicobacter sp. TaxID=218 RepID=UPI00198D18EA|nr:MFS transporter [Helicobacter sp.]MBD5164907.1 MFS transporter [Helicobacter sp.]
MPQNLILCSILLAVFVVPSSISGTAIALPYIAQKLGSDSALLQWVVNGFNLFFACFTLIWGAISDRWGAKHCLLVGVALYLIASLFSGFAPTLLWLDIARVFAGIGGASVFACGSALLMRTFSAKDHAKVFAAFGTTAGLGITLGPTISGFLIDIFTYQAIFIFHFLILTVVFVIIFFLPKEKQKQQAFDFDIIGAILFLAFMLGLMFLIMNLNDYYQAYMSALFVFCIVIGIVFVWHQKSHYRHNQIPFLDIAVLNNPTFVGFTLVTVIAGFSFVVLLTYFPIFLSAVFSLSASFVGVFMLALTAPMLFCPILAARFLNKGVNPKLFAFIMSLMMSMGLFLLLVVLYFLSDTMQIPLIPLALFIIGCGMGLHAGAIDRLALSSVDSKKSGFAAGVLNSFRLGSEAVGVALYGALMPTFISANSGDSLHPYVSIIASGNLDSIENLNLQSEALFVYLQAFFMTIGILGILSLILSFIVWVLLRRQTK